MHFKKASYWFDFSINGTFPLDTGGWDNVNIMLFQLQRRLLETAFNPTSFLKARKKFIFTFLNSILLYMKKLSNTVNHSSKLMLTYFFRAVFINLYFKTEHSNETFHLGFNSLSNVFSYRKHITSKSINHISVLYISNNNNKSVLTIFGKSRNIKTIAPSLPCQFIIIPPILWYSLNIPLGSFYYDPPTPYFKIFFWNTHPLLIQSSPLQLTQNSNNIPRNPLGDSLWRFPALPHFVSRSCISGFLNSLLRSLNNTLRKKLRKHFKTKLCKKKGSCLLLFVDTSN